MRRMNKIIKNHFFVMAVIAVGFTTNSVAQEQEETSAFKIPLEYSQGFIVLDDTKNVDHWRIDIENVTLMNASDPDAKTSIVISGLNYFKMPDNYDHLNHSMIINVTGFSESNEMLISDVSTIQNNEAIDLMVYPPPTTKFEQCKIVCNGAGYAYEIVSYAENDISSPFLQLESTSNDGVPFYQYMTHSQYYVNCLSGPQPNPCGFGTLRNIKIETAPPGTYVDIANNPIYGDVYGIAKDLGPWGGNAIVTNVLAGLPDPGCGQLPQWFINTINTASGPNGSQNTIDKYGKPDLVCNPDFNDMGGATMGSNGWDMNCIQNINIQFGFDGDLSDYFNLIADCMGADYGQYWERISQVSIANIGSPNVSEDPITIISSELFNEDGSFNSPNIYLEEGLYSIGMVNSDNGSYLPVLKEVKQPFHTNIDLSTLFTANIFANPIIGDEFNMEMSVDATLDFKFVLTDINGVMLLDKDFVIRKDEIHTENIRLPENNTFPTGTLIASFIFKDGSTKSYNIIKK